MRVFGFAGIVAVLGRDCVGFAFFAKRALPLLGCCLLLVVVFLFM